MLASARVDARMYEGDFEVVEGAEGEQPSVVTKAGLDGVTAGLTPKEWLEGRKDISPHWWEPASNVGGTPRKGGTTGANPWAGSTWNFGEQNRIQQESPDRAAKLAAAAGTTVGGARPAIAK